MFGNFIVNLLSCCDRDTLSNKDHVSEIVQLSKNWGEWISTILIIWQLEVFCLIQQKPYMRSTGMSMHIYIYIYMSQRNLTTYWNKSSWVPMCLRPAAHVAVFTAAGVIFSPRFNQLAASMVSSTVHPVQDASCHWRVVVPEKVHGGLHQTSVDPPSSHVEIENHQKKQNTHIKFDTCLSPHKATQLWRNTSKIRGIENDCYLFWGPKCQISAMLSLLSCVFPAPVPGKCFPLRAEMRHPQSPEFEHIYYLL